MPVAEDDPRIRAAARKAAKELETAVTEQEAAVNRILGLCELLMARAPDRDSQLKIEAVMEACGFQDLTGQRIRKVRGLLKHLGGQPLTAVQKAQAEQALDERALDGPAQPGQGLSQEEVDRLLKGGKPS